MNDQIDRGKPNYSNESVGDRSDFVDDLSSPNFSSDVGPLESEQEKSDGIQLESAGMAASEFSETPNKYWDDYEDRKPEENFSSLGDLASEYGAADVAPSEPARQQPELEQDEFGRTYDQDPADGAEVNEYGEPLRGPDGRPILNSYETYDEFVEDMSAWKMSQGQAQQAQAAAEQAEVADNIAGLAELGVDPAGNSDPEYLNLCNLKRQAEKALSEHRPGSTSYRDGVERVKYLNEMIGERLEKYEKMITAPAKRAARGRITKDAADAVAAAVHGNLSPDTQLFKTAMAAHNAVEAKKGTRSGYFVDALSLDDRNSFRNAGQNHVVLITFPESYDGDPVADAKSHGHIRSDGSVDLTTWAIKCGGSVFKKGAGGQPEEIEPWM